MSSIEAEAARRHPGVGAIAVMRRNEFTEGAMWALEQAEKAIGDAAPTVNAELRFDGTEDPGMSAYVEGIHAALDALRVLGGKSENTKEDD